MYAKLTLRKFFDGEDVDTRERVALLNQQSS